MGCSNHKAMHGDLENVVCKYHFHVLHQCASPKADHLLYKSKACLRRLGRGHTLRFALELHVSRSTVPPLQLTSLIFSGISLGIRR